MNVKGISFERYGIWGPQKNLCKSYGLWILGLNDENCAMPAIYFKKPKWLSDEQFVEILRAIKLDTDKLKEVESDDKE